MSKFKNETKNETTLEDITLEKDIDDNKLENKNIELEKKDENIEDEKINNEIQEKTNKKPKNENQKDKVEEQDCFNYTLSSDYEEFKLPIKIEKNQWLTIEDDNETNIANVDLNNKCLVGKNAILNTKTNGLISFKKINKKSHHLGKQTNDETILKNEETFNVVLKENTKIIKTYKIVLNFN